MNKFGIKIAALLFSVSVYSIPSRAEAFEQLVGSTWKTGFVGDPQGLQLQYSRKFLVENKMIETIRIKIDHPLLSGAFAMEMHFNYHLGEAVPSLSNTKQLDMTFVQVFETLLDEGMVTQRNQDNYCGFSDWEVGVKRDITGLACASDEGDFFNVGDQYFDILQVNNQQLRIGFAPDEDTSHDGSTAEKRTVALDPDKVYVRQP